MVLAAGRLRDRVRIERPVKQPDGAGGYERTWTEVMTVWAEALPTGGRERLAAGSLRSSQGWSVTIRYRTGITPEDRMILNPRLDDGGNVIEGQVLNIHSIEDPDRRRERLVALCETGGEG